MAKYIDADKLRAIVKRQIRRENFNFAALGGGGQTFCTNTLEWILKQIDSLPQEPPSLPSNLDEAAENRVTENGRFEITSFEKMRIDDIMFGAEWMAREMKQEQPECHTVKEWMQRIQNADQLTKDIFTEGPYDVLYDALNHPYSFCYDAIKEFGALCFQTGVMSVRKEQPEVEFEDKFAKFIEKKDVELGTDTWSEEDLRELALYFYYGRNDDNQPEVDLERDAVQFCFDKGLNVTPYQAKMIAGHFYELGLNAKKIE